MSCWPSHWPLGVSVNWVTASEIAYISLATFQWWGALRSHLESISHMLSSISIHIIPYQSPRNLRTDFKFHFFRISLGLFPHFTRISMVFASLFPQVQWGFPRPAPRPALAVPLRRCRAAGDDGLRGGAAAEHRGGADSALPREPHADGRNDAERPVGSQKGGEFWVNNLGVWKKW